MQDYPHHYLASASAGNQGSVIVSGEGLPELETQSPPQFGGPEGKKFKYRRFRHLLLSLCDQPLSKQHDILENSMNDWKGDNEQVDDILVIGAMPVA